MAKGTHISKAASRRIAKDLRDQDGYRIAWNAAVREQYKDKPPTTRPGIWFTKSQEAQIKAFVVRDNLLSAQQLIIDNLKGSDNE